MNKQLFLSKTDDQSLCYGVFDWCGWPELNASYSKRALEPYHCKGPPVALYLQVSGVVGAFVGGGVGQGGV